MAGTAPQEDPLAGVPELKTYIATDEGDKIAALKLVADSVAQMRQTANNVLVTHPLNMAIAVAILALLARFVYESRGDVFIAGTTCAGVIMTGLAAYRYLTQDYLFAAESINWEWLGDAEVIVTKFGEEVIGTVMVEWVSGEGRQKRKKSWRGEIRAWTVRLKYRRKGVGGALLEEAVKEAKKKGAETIEFADDHASKYCDCLDLIRGTDGASRFEAGTAIAV
jgi:ribosomal protein S18 acetylase RimI-like enzyme